MGSVCEYTALEHLSHDGSFEKVIFVFGSPDATLAAETLQNHTKRLSAQAQALLPNFCHWDDISYKKKTVIFVIACQNIYTPHIYAETTVLLSDGL